MTTVNLAEAAVMASRGLLSLVAAMQIILRPRPRGLDLLSRCGACLMQARLKNKSVLNAPPRTGAELRERGSL